MTKMRLFLSSLFLASSFLVLPSAASAADFDTELSVVEATLAEPIPQDVVAGLSSGETRCSPFLLLRTPLQVVQDLQDAMNARDFDRIACNFARHARVLDDEGVTIGRDNIRARLEGMYQLFGTMPTFTGDLKTTGPIVMGTWELFVPPFVAVPDAVDTFVVYLGQIHYQTGHATFADPSAY